MSSDEPRCPCGHGVGHLMVSELPQYSAWGTFMVYFMGVTTRPHRVDYQCRVCKTVLHSTTDPQVLGALK